MSTAGKCQVRYQGKTAAFSKAKLHPMPHSHTALLIRSNPGWTSEENPLIRALKPASHTPPHRRGDEFKLKERQNPNRSTQNPTANTGDTG